MLCSEIPTATGSIFPNWTRCRDAQARVHAFRPKKNRDRSDVLPRFTQHNLPRKTYRWLGRPRECAGRGSVGSRPWGGWCGGRNSSRVRRPSLFLSSFARAVGAVLISVASITPSRLASRAWINGETGRRDRPSSGLRSCGRASPDSRWRGRSCSCCCAFVVPAWRQSASAAMAIVVRFIGEFFRSGDPRPASTGKHVCDVGSFTRDENTGFAV